MRFQQWLKNYAENWGDVWFKENADPSDTASKYARFSDYATLGLPIESILNSDSAAMTRFSPSARVLSALSKTP